MHISAIGPDATAPWSGQLASVDSKHVHTHQALRLDATPHMISLTGIHISSDHRGRPISHCRSTWTRNGSHVPCSPRRMANTFQTRRAARMRSWLLQGFCRVRARGWPPSTNARQGTSQESAIFQRASLKLGHSSVWHALHPPWLDTHLGTWPHTRPPTTPRTRSSIALFHPRLGNCLPHTHPPGNQP